MWLFSAGASPSLQGIADPLAAALGASLCILVYAARSSQVGARDLERVLRLGRNRREAGAAELAEDRRRRPIPSRADRCLERAPSAFLCGRGLLPRVPAPRRGCRILLRGGDTSAE